MTGQLINNIRSFFPPAAKYTEKEVSSQAGKVFLITGASTGVGKELAKILYSKDAKVYVAARSKDKANIAIEEIKAACPKSKGSLTFLHLDLDDLTTIKASANEFLSKEPKLHVLFNNAGVAFAPQGSKTKQGYELHMGTNCVAPFLFTKFLVPILKETAKTAPTGTIRVVWVSSAGTELVTPKGGIDLNNLDYMQDKSPTFKYGISKAGNYYHSTEFAKRYQADGIVSVALNPGNLKTPLYRHMSSLQKMATSLIVHDPIQGAYTELFAGVSPDVTIVQTGKWIQPWGRFVDIRSDLAVSAKSAEDGGTGVGEKFWGWTEEQVQPYL